MSSEFQCYHCSAVVKFEGIVGRQDSCDSCMSDLHVCKNCQFYDTTAYNECREPAAEVVREKEKSNFCDYFAPATDRQGAGVKRDGLLSAAEALFKKKD